MEDVGVLYVIESDQQKTSGYHQGRVVYKVSHTKRHDDGQHSDLVDIIKPLGLYNTRAQRLIKMSEGYVNGFKSVDELYGVGQYAKDSWEIFQNNNLNVKPNDKVLQEYLRQEEFT